METKMKGTILLVDDEPANLGILCEYLEVAGEYKVLMATSGESALRQAARAKPDMILLDVKLPGMDGFEICRRLKENETTQDIPIVFLSAVTETEEKVTALELGAMDYITKPFRLAEVLARVEKHLTIHKLQKSLEERNAQLEREIAARKQAEETLRRRNRDLILLNQAGQALNSTLELDAVLTVILRAVRDLLGVLNSSIWLLEPETSAASSESEAILICRHMASSQSASIRGWRVPVSQGIVGWTVRNRRGIIVPDTRDDPHHYKDIDQHTEREIRSILAVPLWEQRTVTGVLEVVDTMPQKFMPSDLQAIESLAAAASVAIQNARLYAQTQQDAQTKADLLQEVNHRVSNNLTAIVGLLHAERRYAPATAGESRAAIETMLARLAQRVTGLARVHRMLSQSQWAPVRLSDLADQIIEDALSSLPPQQHINVHFDPSPVEVSPRQAGNLALIITELATNTVKHAMGGRATGRIAVSSLYEDEEMRRRGDEGARGQVGTILFEYRDDGPGYPETVLGLEEHDVGLYLIQRLAQSLQGTVTLANDGGAVTRLRFETEDRDRT
jgi:DNA-binding response OmpR family regulator/anti-sigma regulatory factor (Ser/Thr protein kinase)